MYNLEAISENYKFHSYLLQTKYVRKRLPHIFYV